MLKYLERKSLVHGVDARVKLVGLILLSVAFIASPLQIAALALPAALFLFLLARLPFSKLVEEKVLLLVSFTPFVFRFFFDKGAVEFLGFSLPTWVLNGFLNSFYVLGVLLLAITFVLTTRLRELRLALLFFRVPKRIVFMFSVALQAIPLLQERVSRTNIAQKTRGAGRNPLPLVLPVLHNLFSRARKLAISLECRGFDPEKP